MICRRIANAGLRKIPYVSALLTLVALSRARGTVQDLYYQVRGRGRSGGHFGKQCTPSAPPLAPKTKKQKKLILLTVRRFGGFVAKYMGDGVLVYFGYPQALLRFFEVRS